MNSFIPVSGTWSAVYANEGEDCSLRTEPVIMWGRTHENGVDVVVGVVALGPSIVPATAPDLLGYARDGENISAKFAEALKAFKKEEATHAIALHAARLRGASVEVLAGRLREKRTGTTGSDAAADVEALVALLREKGRIRVPEELALGPGRITELANKAANAACECRTLGIDCEPCIDGHHDFCLTACAVLPAIDMCQRVKN